MPFYAKDWRSPGESWIKTEDGWEKLKVLETNRIRADSLNNNNNSSDDDKENFTSPRQDNDWVPPHCRITLKCTKEVAGFNGLSDALHRLDFRSAVHDHRRFPYTVKLLELLLSQHRITNLSGCAQKSVLSVLEEIAIQAQSSNQNVHVLVRLLTELRLIVRGESWWGQPLGSSQLWGKHVETIDRIDAIASNAQQQGDNESDKNRSRFEDLPEVCVREILFRLADHRDLWAASEASIVAQKLSAEQRLWKRLCRYHFSPTQIDFAMKEAQKDKEKPPQSIKSNRGARSSHPYRSSPRSSPVRTLDNNDYQRKQEQTLQERSSDNHEENKRLVSFQDVRNHFDRQESWNNAKLSTTKRNSYEERLANNSNGDIDWEDIFHRARRFFGLREEYAEVLHLCRICRCLFWKSYGHPCIDNASSSDNGYIPVPPQAFLKFFSL